jgi:hypothetical protein
MVMVRIWILLLHGNLLPIEPPVAHLAVGRILVLLFVAAIVVGLIFLLRSRRLSRRTLLVLGGLVLISLALLLFYAMMRKGHVHVRDFFLILALLGPGLFLLWRALERGPRWLWARIRCPGCPPVSRLRDLLAERLPAGEHARLTAHLDTCPACQHCVEKLTADQPSWLGMARNLRHEAQPAVPALREVIDRLKGWEKPEATREEPAFADDLPLGFLAPSDKPGHLGRLERYEVLEEIGRGGMGIVLKAFDPSLHRVVAIKVMAPQLATSGVGRKRFLREARAAACVTHDHIVTIHAVDEANGLPYLVMQYVPGLSLQQRIDRDGPLTDLVEVLRIGMQTASALAAAHAHGIVHRDIKPGNILLEEGVQRVKITDFGLARALDDASLTQSGVVAGSPLYMAPEQARGDTPDHRADLFSLGSVLYTMCTGRPPFRAANTLAVLRRVSEDTPRPIRETNPEVPDWLAAIVDKLMAKDSSDRYQSAGEVVEVLGRHLTELQHGAYVPPPAAAGLPPGLPSSLTICPSCGASLHVPEKLVGSIVHCEACGRPFRPEDTSEEIVVARAMPSPFGRPMRRKGIPWWLIVAWVGFMIFALFMALYESPATTHRPTAAKSFGTPESTRPAGEDSFWKRPLAWLPGEATFFGAIDLQVFGSLKLEDDWTQGLLRLVLPAEAVKQVTPENLGRIRIDTLSMGYYEGPLPSKSHVLVQVEGLALDGRKRIIDFIRTAGGIRAGQEERFWPPEHPTRVRSPALPFAIGLYDDHRVLLARAVGGDGTEAENLRALEHHSSFSGRPSQDILSGYNPPWLKLALQNIPNRACGLCLGEIPAAGRRLLREALGLQACPRTFVCSLQQENDGVAFLSLTLNLDKAGGEQILRGELQRLCSHGLDPLVARYPALLQEAAPLALLGQTLMAIRWQAIPGSGSVRTTVRITDATREAVLALLNRAGKSGDGGQKKR